MSNQLQITGGAKVRALDGVITGTTGVLSSVPLGGANGVATLDSSGKVPLAQLPASVFEYKGTWNATTNTPYLVNGVGTSGWVYVVSVGGLHDFGAGSILFLVGDQVLYDGSIWERSSGATGSVTSVALTAPSAFNVSGSPITTSGTLAITGAGTTSQYINGAGSLTTFPSLTGFVPYTGATNDLNLGTHNLFANNLFDGFTNVAASGTQIVLTIASTPSYTITGSGGQTIKLPDATTLPNGAIFSFNNNQSSGAITVNNNSNTLVVSVPSGGFAELVLLDNSIAAGSWDRHFKAPSNVSWSTNTLDYAGSITSATWNGNVVAINRGGTGSSTQNFVDLTTTQTIGGAKTFSSSLTASSLIKTGGTSSQFLKADGSVDSSTYLTTSSAASTYVPYTGATANLDLGIYSITGSIGTFTQGVFNGNGTSPANLYLKKGSAPFFSNAANYGLIAAVSSSFILISDVDGTNYKYASFNLGSLTNNTNRAFTLPDASGTLALTSDLNGYVPYTGATANLNLGIYGLTTSGVDINTTGGGNAGINFYLTSVQKAFIAAGSTFLTFASQNTDGFKFQNPSNATIFSISNTGVLGNGTYSYTLPSATGTLALTSQLTSGTVTSVAALTLGTTGTDLSSSVANSTTTPVITLNVPTASASNRGVLSSADWTTFNGKFTLPSLTSGSVLFSNGSTISQSNTNFFWDNTNARLGIGTNAPSAGVTSYSTTAATQFKAAGTAPAITFSDTLVSSTYAAVFGLATSANHFVTGTATGDMAIANQSTSAGAIVFGTGTTEKMRMTSTGKFSIGNTNDTYNLDVTGTGRFTGALTLGTTAAPSYGSGSLGVNLGILNIQNVVGVQGSYANNAYYNGTNWIGISASYNATAIRLIQTGDISFHSAAAVTAGGTLTTWDTTDIKMTIKASGNVGIGTSSPAYTLDVSGSGRYLSGNEALRLDTTSTAFDTSIRFYNNNSATYWGGIQAGPAAISGGGMNIYNNGAYPMVFGVNGAERMRITSGGSVCIGSTSPLDASAKLNVSGYVYFGLIASGAGNSTLKYNTSTGLMSYDTSARAFKKDIVDLEYGLDAVLKMSSKKYKWKLNETEDLGFIADEMYQIIPEVVFLADNNINQTGLEDNEPMGINYDRLVPVLVKAIQEMNTKLDEQNQTIQNLQEQINILAK